MNTTNEKPTLTNASASASSSSSSLSPQAPVSNYVRGSKLSMGLLVAGVLLIGLWLVVAFFSGTSGIERYMATKTIAQNVSDMKRMLKAGTSKEGFPDDWRQIARNTGVLANRHHIVEGASLAMSLNTPSAYKYIDFTHKISQISDDLETLKDKNNLMSLKIQELPDNVKKQAQGLVGAIKGVKNGVILGIFKNPSGDAEQKRLAIERNMRVYASRISDLANKVLSSSAVNREVAERLTEWDAASSRVTEAIVGLNKFLSEGTGFIEAGAKTMAGLMSYSPEFTERRIGLLKASYIALAAGWFFVLLGIFLMLLNTAANKKHQKMGAITNKRDRHARRAVEKITSRMKQATNQNGVIDSNMRIEEDAGSPAFTLSNMINHILAARDVMIAGISESRNTSERSMSELDDRLGYWRTQIADIGDEIRGAESGMLESAHNNKGLSEQIAGLRSDCDETVVKIGKMKENTSKIKLSLKGMREGAQSQSKGLKRLTEGVQSLQAVVDMIVQINKHIQILAINNVVAISGSNSAEDTSEPMMLAQETEMLAKGAKKKLEDAKIAIRDIRQDSKANTILSEEGISKIVEAEEFSQKTTLLISQMLEAVIATGAELEGVEDGVNKYIETEQSVSSSIKDSSSKWEGIVSDTDSVIKSSNDVASVHADIFNRLKESVSRGYE